MQRKIERDRKRGILNRPVRAHGSRNPECREVHIHQRTCRKSLCKTGNKPGVTKGKQWIRLNKQVELLDTPGILWPKFEDQAVGLRLAFIGSMKDEILQTEELAAELIKFLRTALSGSVTGKICCRTDEDDYVVLHHIAKNRNCVVKGNELNTEKVALLSP